MGTWVGEHWLAVVLLLGYTAILFYNAYVGSRAGGDAAGYYVGGRGMGGVAIGISFFATFASTNSYIGHAGKGYSYGVPWMALAATLILFTYLSWRWIAPRLRRYAVTFDALTIPDFLGGRYPGDASGTLRVAAAVVIVFSSVLYLIAIFKGAGHLFQQFLNLSYEASVGVTLLIVVLYTSIGGFVSVVRTDVVQGVLMVLGSMTIFWFVSDAAGGLDAMTTLSSQAETEHLFELNAGIPFAVLMGISLSGALKLLVDPRQLSRFYALKDDRELKKGFWIALIGLVVVFGCLFPIGILSHLLLDNVTDTDLIVPTLIADRSVFPLWAGDFLIVAIIAAAMSSMDSVLLVAASTCYRNLVEPFRPSDRPVRWTRVAVLAFAGLSALLALRPPGDIVEITIFSGSLYAACFLPAMLFGLHTRRGSARSVLASMGAGVLTLALWFALDLRGIVHEVFPALIFSFAAFWAVSPRSPDRRAPESPA